MYFNCLIGISTLMSHSYLIFNLSKTEFVILSTPAVTSTFFINAGVTQFRNQGVILALFFPSCLCLSSQQS